MQPNRQNSFTVQTTQLARILHETGAAQGFKYLLKGVLRRNVVALFTLLLPLCPVAQTPPSDRQIAHYAGLHAAAHSGDIASIKRLIAGKADVNVRDPQGRTPLHVATFARHVNAIRTLAAAGADLGLLEHERYDAITIAAVANDEKTLRALLSLGASAKLVTSRYDGTALIAAAHLGHVGVIRQLIAANAPLDHVNNLHWTALIEAIVLGDGGVRHVATVRALVDAGADTQLSDRSGDTPLRLAKARGYRAMVEILENAGAK